MVNSIDSSQKTLTARRILHYTVDRIAYDKDVGYDRSRLLILENRFFVFIRPNFF